MITIHISQLLLTDGIPDFGNVGLDTIVEMPDTYRNQMMLTDILLSAKTRSEALKADLIVGNKDKGKLYSGPVITITISSTETIDNFCRTGSKMGSPAPITHLELDAHLVTQTMTENNFIINYRWDYGLQE